jgi:flagellar biosynthetic protein FliR
MQAITLNAADVSSWMGRLWWPSLRIGGFVLTAPIASEVSIPKQVKIVLTLVLAGVMAPLAPVPGDLSILSGVGVLTAVQEVIIGAAIGMVMQLAFDALTFAGQMISLSMGLGFATLIDPQRGASVPVVGQLVSMMGTLAYLAMNGHLVLVGALANSYQTLRIGAANLDRDFLLCVAKWGGRIFETGLLIALPASIALLIVNMALGVISRAAPTLNLFGIGFTITVMGGMLTLIVGLDAMMLGISDLLDGTLRLIVELVASQPAAVR